MAKQSFFVTGTDTGVGKTLVSAAILQAAKAMGKHTLAMKPIASGCGRTPEGLRNEDALILQNAITEPLAYELINPVALEPAIAPHVAAEQAGRHITSDRLVGFCRGLQIRPADLLLVEGAGGSRSTIGKPIQSFRASCPCRSFSWFHCALAVLIMRFLRQRPSEVTVSEWQGGLPIAPSLSP